MPRFRVAVLVGLMLAGSLRAQAPGEDFPAPAPTPLPSSEPGTIPPTTMAMPATGGSALVGPMPFIEAAPPAYNTLSALPTDDWRFWANAEYALAFLKGKTLPPLATTSPAGTPQAQAGVFGTTGVSSLIGGSPINQEARSMGRLGFGYWFDRERTLGVDAGFFVTESKGNAFGAASNGTTILARPFVNANTGVPSSVLVGFPGISSGSVNAFAAMQTFWGANVDVRESVISESWFRLESLIGYRYLHYGESLDMQQVLMPAGPGFVAGTTILSRDSFVTVNDFHGCEFGFRTEVFRERWSLELLTKMAAGRIRREVIINGSTQTTVPGAATTTGTGGVYALSSNIGTHFDDAWVVAPELGLNMGYQLTDNVRVRLGYSFLLLSQIGRAADQIDFNLNPNLFPPAVAGAPGPANPAFSFIRSDIWIQSINLGLEVRF